MSTLSERIRWFLATRGTTGGLALIVVGVVLLGSVGVAYAGSPETTTVTEQRTVETFDVELGTSATVTGHTTLFAPGETLSEPPVYLADAAPVATLSATTTVPNDRAISVTQQISLVIKAVDGDRVFWQEHSVLATETADVTNGTLTTRATLNVTQFRETRLETVRTEVGGAGRVETFIVVESAIDSGRYADRLSVTTPLTISQSAYEFGDERTASATHSTPVNQTMPVQREVPQSRLAGGGLLVVGGIGLALIGRRKPDSATALVAHVRYSEWVSTGSVGRLDDDRVAITTLGDLVDLAIDSRKRVIHDRDRGLYIVLDDGVTYTFDPLAGNDEDTNTE